jgi:hypothetical protein
MKNSLANLACLLLIGLLTINPLSAATDGVADSTADGELSSGFNAELDQYKKPGNMPQPPNWWWKLGELLLALVVIVAMIIVVAQVLRRTIGKGAIGGGGNTGPIRLLGSHHFDQLGRYTGSVWLDGRELAINALGFRDRMWGWGGRKHWRSYLIMWAAFGEDCIANVALQRFDDGRKSLSGYLHLDGTRSLLQTATAEVDWHPHRWKTVVRVNNRVQDALGRNFEFSGRPQGILDTGHHWPQRTDHMLFSVGEYRHGDLIGHGVMNWAFASQADQFHRLEASTG